MRKKIVAAMVMVFMLGFATDVLAQNIRERINSQQHRINQGVRRGELTRGEAHTLRANLDHIRWRYDKARSEGTLRYERRHISRLLDRNSRMIYKKRHNPVVRLF